MMMPHMALRSSFADMDDELHEDRWPCIKHIFSIISEVLTSIPMKSEGSIYAVVKALDQLSGSSVRDITGRFLRLAVLQRQLVLCVHYVIWSLL